MTSSWLRHFVDLPPMWDAASKLTLLLAVAWLLHLAL